VEKGDVALAQQIASPYERVLALTGVGQPTPAASEATSLAEPSPLVGVMAALAPTEPSRALSLVDRLTRESDKADALRSLAEATGDQATFDRALAMAGAARVRGDPLAPARASLELARTFARRPGGEANAAAALAQAYDLVSAIGVKYK
jgi:hypothetical protein